MNLESEHIIKYLISQFPTATKTVVMKMVYLGEIKSIEENKERFTDVVFKHYNYGPYAATVADVYSDADKKQKIELTGISPNKINILHKLIDEFQKYAEYDFKGTVFDNFINKAYKTLPFLETNFNEVIHFEKYIGRSFISQVVINSQDYKKFSNPIYKTKNQKINKIADDLMEFFDTYE